MNKIPGGIYPVMITPFTADNQIDYNAVDRIVEFYAQRAAVTASLPSASRARCSA